MRGTTVTWGDVKRIRELAEKIPDESTGTIARLSGRSEATVKRALRGDYDYLDPDYGKRATGGGSGTGAFDGGDALAVQASKVCEQLVTTRNVMIEAYDSTTLGELYNLLADTNRLLAQVAFMMANGEDPEHGPSKATAAHFRSMVKSYMIKE